MLTARSGQLLPQMMRRRDKSLFVAPKVVPSSSSSSALLGRTRRPCRCLSDDGDEEKKQERNNIVPFSAAPQKKNRRPRPAAHRRDHPSRRSPASPSVVSSPGFDVSTRPDTPSAPFHPPLPPGERCSLVRTLLPDRATAAALITALDGGQETRTWTSVRDHARRAPPGRRLYLSVLDSRGGSSAPAAEDDTAAAAARRLLLAYRSEEDARAMRDRLAASMDVGLAARQQQQQQQQQRFRSCNGRAPPSRPRPPAAWRFLCIESWPVDALVRDAKTAGMGVLLHGGDASSSLVFPAPNADDEAARAQMRAALLHGWGWKP